MTPTNTPTSKCCPRCRGKLKAKDFCAQVKCPCHTPTTDPSTSVEALLYRVDEQIGGAARALGGDTPTTDSKNTADKGWDNIRAAIESKPHQQYGKVDCWALDKAIKELAKEEYERGRKDAGKDYE